MRTISPLPISWPGSIVCSNTPLSLLQAQLGLVCCICFIHAVICSTVVKCCSVPCWTLLFSVVKCLLGLGGYNTALYHTSAMGGKVFTVLRYSILLPPCNSAQQRWMLLLQHIVGQGTICRQVLHHELLHLPVYTWRRCSHIKTLVTSTLRSAEAAPAT